MVRAPRLWVAGDSLRLGELSGFPTLPAARATANHLAVAGLDVAVAGILRVLMIAAI